MEQSGRNQTSVWGTGAGDGSAPYFFSVDRRIFRSGYICDGHYRQAFLASIRLDGRTIALSDSSQSTNESHCQTKDRL